MFVINFLYPSFIKLIREQVILETISVFIFTHFKLSKKKKWNSIKMNLVVCEWFVPKLLLHLLKSTYFLPLLYTLIVFPYSDSFSFSRKTQVYKIKISKQSTLKIHLYLNFNTSLLKFLEKKRKISRLCLEIYNSCEINNTQDI